MAFANHPANAFASLIQPVIRKQADSPKVSMREGVARPHLQVLLEPGGAFAGLERDAADQFPRSILSGVEVGAFVAFSRARMS